VSLTPEQLALRQKGLSATDIVYILDGKGKKVFKDKTTPIITAPPNKLTKNGKKNWGTSKMEAGNRMEHAVALWAADEAELGPIEKGKTVFSDTIAWACATPDFYFDLPDKGRGILEIKTTTEWEQYQDDIPPWKVVVQVNWQYLVTGVQYGFVGALISGWDLRVIPIQRDEILIRKLVKIGGKFWEMVQKKEYMAA
jgi:hypothetical protein